MTEHRRSGRRSRRPVVVQPDVTLKLSGDRNVLVRSRIVQRTETEWFAFGDAECLWYEPISHRFDVIAGRPTLDHIWDRDEEAGDALWEELRAACSLPAATPARGRDLPLQDEDDLWLAYLDVDELPAHMVAPDGNWAPIISALGERVADAYPIVDAIRHGAVPGFGVPLIFGSLFIPQLLAVHPVARGQDLGLRLLAHALWALHRADGDVAIIQAMPAANLFEAKRPARPPESYARLVRYYSRIGFMRWRPRRRPHSPGGSVMVLPLGERGVTAQHESGVSLFV
jgi:GNAT superfamily N-acetyltransferase